MGKINAFILAIVVGLCAVACQRSTAKSAQKPVVLVTLSPYAFLVKELADGLVDVETLIPEGANPHIYEAPPQAVAKHQGASLWFYLGENFDKKMLQFLKENAAAPRAINLTAGIDLIGEECACEHHHEEGKDLHLWMSPKVVKHQVAMMADVLRQTLPEHSSLLTEREEKLLQTLDALDARISTTLAAKQGTTLLVSHPAFAYFCRDYGLQQLSIEVEGKEPKPLDLHRIIQQARDEKVGVIITEPQHSNKGAVALGEFLNIPIHEINPYAENYIDTLEQLSQLIAHVD